MPSADKMIFVVRDFICILRVAPPVAATYAKSSSQHKYYILSKLYLLLLK